MKKHQARAHRSTGGYERMPVVIFTRSVTRNQLASHARYILAQARREEAAAENARGHHDSP
jgi:hypothetical protein